MEIFILEFSKDAIKQTNCIFPLEIQRALH